jgi:two-component system sensor histidine kinase KdpD
MVGTSQTSVNGERPGAGFDPAAVARSLVATAQRYGDPAAYTAGVADACDHLAAGVATAARNALQPRLAIIAHELQTPVAVIAMTLQTLAERADLLDDAQRGEVVQAARRQVGELIRLLDHLQMADEADGVFGVDIEVVDLAALTRRTLDDLATVTRDHRLDPQLPAQGCEALADPEAVRRIVSALVSNAAKYSAAGEPIEVAVERGGDLVVVSVADRGPGIAPEMTDAVFRRGLRLRRDIDGKGLGLFLARGLARAQHGTLTAATRRDGGGAVFFLTLPASTRAPLVAGNPGCEPPAG